MIVHQSTAAKLTHALAKPDHYSSQLLLLPASLPEKNGNRRIVAINIVWTGVNIGHRIKDAHSSLFRSLDRQGHRS
jgi:hypothetical protein